MHPKLETTASADWRTEYGHNRIATAAHGRIDHFSTRPMTTNSTASADRADHIDSRHAPTDDEIEQLVQILLDRLDEQGSPTYIGSSGSIPSWSPPRDEGMPSVRSTATPTCRSRAACGRSTRRCGRCGG
jgi:hypothetical protein